MPFSGIGTSHDADDDNIFDEVPLMVDDDGQIELEGEGYTEHEHNYGEEETEEHMEEEEDVNSDMAQLRQVRLTLSKINDGLENVTHQMKYFNSNMSQTSQLLDSWINIMSQTFHTHKFLADPQWQGGKMDDFKVNELKQQQIQRELEEERRREKERLRREQEAAMAAAAASAAAAEAARPPVHPGLGVRSSYGIARGHGRGRGRGISGMRPVARSTNIGGQTTTTTTTRGRGRSIRGTVRR